MERARVELNEALNERDALLAREERVMAMVDAADREYRSEKARFAEKEATMRQMITELKEDLEHERREHKSGVKSVRERESADARELGALRRRNDELVGEVESLKNSNAALRKAQLQAKTDRSEWLEGEAAEMEKRLKASEAQCKSLKGELQFEKSSVTKMESQALGLHKTIKDLNAAAMAKDGKIAQLQARVEELNAKLANALSDLAKSGPLSSREKAVENKSAAVQAKETEVTAREKELKESLAKLKAREASCASREKALAKSEASVSRATGKEVASPAPTPGPRYSFADIARRYVFTPGMNAESPATSSKSPAPARTPVSEKTKNLFTGLFAPKESESKAGDVASAISAKKTEIALKAFGVLQKVVGSKEEQPKAIQAPKRLEQTFKVASPAPKSEAKKAATPAKVSPSKSQPKAEKIAAKRSRIATDESEKADEPPTRNTRVKRETVKAKDSEEVVKEGRSSRTRKPTAKAAEASLPATTKKTAEKKTTEEETKEEEPKRKRGRPAKMKEPETEFPSTPKPKKAEPVEEESNKEKRGRGRPAKSRTASQLTDFLQPGKVEASTRTTRGSRRSTRNSRE